jgi:hypothetical protein
MKSIFRKSDFRRLEFQKLLCHRHFRYARQLVFAMNAEQLARSQTNRNSETGLAVEVCAAHYKFLEVHRGLPRATGFALRRSVKERARVFFRPKFGLGRQARGGGLLAHVRRADIIATRAPFRGTELNAGAYIVFPYRGRRRWVDHLFGR